MAACAIPHLKNVWLLFSLEPKASRRKHLEKKKERKKCSGPLLSVLKQTGRPEEMKPGNYVSRNS